MRRNILSWFMVIGMILFALGAFRVNKAEAISIMTEKVVWSVDVLMEFEVDAYDFAKAWTQAPGGPVNSVQQENGHPSVASKDDSPNARAKAFANGFTNERWTAWIVDAASGWNAGATATANRTVTITNTSTVSRHVEFQLILLPEPVFKGRTDSQATGEIDIDYLVYEGGTEIWSSHADIDSWTSGIISDTTGSLTWEKQAFAGYSDSYLLTTDQVLLNSYSLDLNPGEVKEFDFQLSYESSIGNVSGSGKFEEYVVPEPSTWLLLGSGLTALVWFRRKEFFKKA